MDLLWTFWVFGFKIIPYYADAMSLILKINAKPYKMFEWKNWNGGCNWCKEFILTKTTRSNILLDLKDSIN